MSIEDIFPTDPHKIADLTEMHEENAKAYAPESDEVTVVIADDGFLADIEGRGIRRRVFHDLGFDMEPEAEAPVRQRIDLTDGYDVYDRSMARNANGTSKPAGYKTIRGRGRGSIITQGEKHGEA